jgi:cytochrome c
MHSTRRGWTSLGAGLAIVGTACTAAGAPSIAGGNAERGAQTIAVMGCGSCHHIPGVAGAAGLVGPPLDNVAQRGMLAGELPNTPENMVRWIRDPQSVEPNTAMPNLDVGEQSARDIVAYLYSIH